MKIGFAQINATVGNLRGNCELIIGAYERLAAAGAELILTPELAITGYPPQDLVFKSRFVPENLALLEKLHSCVGEAALLVGFVDRNEGRGKPFHNAAALLEKGKPIRKAHKSLLPTYDVFDEDRYFEPACRVETFDALARAYRRPICYCNAVGGNDQLLFDGNSIAVNASGDLIAQLASFREEEAVIDTESKSGIEFREGKIPEELFSALSLGLRDYLRKCNFKSAVRGLSGGAVHPFTPGIPVDGLGAEMV